MKFEIRVSYKLESPQSSFCSKILSVPFFEAISSFTVFISIKTRLIHSLSFKFKIFTIFEYGYFVHITDFHLKLNSFQIFHFFCNFDCINYKYVKFHFSRNVFMSINPKTINHYKILFPSLYFQMIEKDPLLRINRLTFHQLFSNFQFQIIYNFFMHFLNKKFIFQNFN